MISGVCRSFGPGGVNIWEPRVRAVATGDPRIQCVLQSPPRKKCIFRIWRSSSPRPISRVASLTPMRSSAYLRLCRANWWASRTASSAIPTCRARCSSCCGTRSARAEIFAYVKNITKNGDHYWVFAHVTPCSFRGQAGRVSFQPARAAARGDQGAGTRLRKDPSGRSGAQERQGSSCGRLPVRPRLPPRGKHQL